MKAIVIECEKWIDDTCNGYRLEIKLPNGKIGVVDPSDNKKKYAVGAIIEVDLIERGLDRDFYKIV